MLKNKVLMRLQILSQIPSFNLLQFVSINETRQEEPIRERDSFSILFIYYLLLTIIEKELFFFF